MNETKNFNIDNLIIRPMTRADITAVAVLELVIFPDAWPESAFYEMMEEPENGIIVAECDGVITGYAVYMLEFGEARLANLAVAPDFRGKSIAKKLLNRILDITKEADCSNIFLDVRPTNIAAIGLYRGLWFC